MRALKLAALLSLVATNAWAAMSDSAAMAKALSIWGARAMIGQRRNSTDTYWLKEVGYSDNGTFVIFGSGPNTWEAAFDAVTMTPSQVYVQADAQAAAVKALGVNARLGTIAIYDGINHWTNQFCVGVQDIAPAMLATPLGTIPNPQAGQALPTNMPTPRWTGCGNTWFDALVAAGVPTTP